MNENLKSNLSLKQINNFFEDIESGHEALKLKEKNQDILKNKFNL